MGHPYAVAHVRALATEEASEHRQEQHESEWLDTLQSLRQDTREEAGKLHDLDPKELRQRAQRLHWIADDLECLAEDVEGI